MNDFPSRNVFPHTAAINAQGHLVLGGCDVMDLAGEYGTPLYVYDEETLRKVCRQYREEFDSRYPDTRVIYAAKAFINVALVGLLREEGLGLDVASGGELAVGLAGGMLAAEVYFHGNNKGRDELTEAVRDGIGCIVVDNLHELDLLEEVAQEVGRVQDIMLRVSPGVAPHTHAYISTGALDSKFGLPIETGQAEEAVRQALASKHVRLVGLHCHIGSQLFETEPYVEAVRIVLGFAARMREEGLQLLEFSPGGGFAIAYTRDDEPPSVATFAEAIVSAVMRECEALGFDSQPTLVIEPGRSIVGPAGVALYTVGSRKAIPGVRSYVSVDGGMGDNIRPALYQAQYEAVVANRMEQEPAERVTIAGKFCESGDILVRDVDLPPTEPGDIIAIPASGAYCPAMASNYNMAPRPAIVLVRNGATRLIRRRETFQDMIAADVV